MVSTIWLGIGAQVYKPPVPKPPVSLHGCTNETVLTTISYALSTDPPTSVEDK